jgi:hypothetical protein
MRRRLVWIQKTVPDYPVKMLFERYDGVADGYYVGGWNQEPVFVAVDPGVFGNRLLLYGITATGPGVNDWLVGGWKRVGNVFSFVFYDHTGLISETLADTTGAYALTGHFATGFNPSIDTFYWATSAGASGTGSSPDFITGFVLPNVFAGRRLDETFETLRSQVVPNPNLTYAVFVGNNSVDPGTFPNGNPWLASAGGTFTRLNTNLNAAVRRSDLIGLTLYERDVDFLGTNPWPNAGEHSLTITPHIITTGGIVTTGTPFPVKYQAPDPDAWFTWDASLWVDPPTP